MVRAWGQFEAPTARGQPLGQEGGGPGQQRGDVGHRLRIFAARHVEVVRHWREEQPGSHFVPQPAVVMGGLQQQQQQGGEVQQQRHQEGQGQQEQQEGTPGVVLYEGAQQQGVMEGATASWQQQQQQPQAQKLQQQQLQQEGQKLLLQPQGRQLRVQHEAPTPVHTQRTPPAGEVAEPSLGSADPDPDPNEDQDPEQGPDLGCAPSSSSAPLCKYFASSGRCPKGAACTYLHVHLTAVPGLARKYREGRWVGGVGGGEAACTYLHVHLAAVPGLAHK